MYKEPSYPHCLVKLAIQAMTLEVTCGPKPGLVDSYNSGAHQDMDQTSFLRSIEALRPHLLAYALAGEKLVMNLHVHLAGEEQEQQACLAFAHLQYLGLQGEQASLAANQGVNCHAGLNFAWALILPAASLLQTWQGKEPRPEAICRLVKILAGPAYAAWRQEAGPTIAGGARLAAAQGYPLALDPGLTSLYELPSRLSQSLSCDDLLLIALLRLMAVNPDSNLLRRGGEEGLLWVQARARQILRTFQLDLLPPTYALSRSHAHRLQDKAGFRRALRLFDQEMIKHNLSPGGSADLLALAIFFSLLEGDRPRVKLPKSSYLPDIVSESRTCFWQSDSDVESGNPSQT